MKIGNLPFRGELPARSADQLPDGYGQIARNAKLGSGALEAFRVPLAKGALAKGSAVNSIFPLDIDGTPRWLHWLQSELGVGAAQVDVVHGPVAGDATERIYITGLDKPRVSNLAMATGGGTAGAYPLATYLMGVPAPAAAPSIAIVESEETGDIIALTNPGAESGNTSGWTVASGDLDVHDNTDIPGFGAAAGNYYFFGGTAASATEAHQIIDVAAAGLLPGQLLELRWQQAYGPNRSMARCGLRYYDGGGTNLNQDNFPTMTAAGGMHQWGAQALGSRIPPGTAYIRVVQQYQRVGGGECDAYIDSISLRRYGGSRFSWDGSTLDSLISAAGADSSVTIDSGVGNPAPSFKFSAQNSQAASIYLDAGATRAQSASISFDFFTDGHFVEPCVLVGADTNGGGTGIECRDSGLYQVDSASWTAGPPASSKIGTGGIGEFQMRVVAQFTRTGTAAGTLSIELRRSDDGSIVATASTNVAVVGDFIGIKCSNGDSGNDNGWLDNLVIETTVAETSVDEEEKQATNYVETYVNGWGEESAPTKPSRTIAIVAGAPVQITSATSAPAGYNITAKRRYRAATGTEGTVYRFVEEIPLATATTTDTRLDADLGEVLTTEEDWLPPPDDMRGILALPNGITVGFSGNTLLISPVNRPHAYPVKYRLTTDYPIVAIEAIDTDVVVATQASVYIASGSDPAAFSMSKPAPGGCVSARSMVAIRGGVLFAGSDALVSVTRGAGVVAITQKVLTETQWGALNPSSILGVGHDDRYYGFWDAGGGNKGGFIFDAENGFVPITAHATAAFSLTYTDELYLFIDGQLRVWDAGAELMPYLYRSRLDLLPRPGSMEFGRIRRVGTGADDLTFRLYYDGTVVMEQAISDPYEFLLPDVIAQDSVEWELEGTATVRRQPALAESVEELAS